MGNDVREPLVLVLSVLATWRITALIAYESGPFRSLEALRRGLVQIRLGRLVGCFHCLGLWVSGLVVLVIYRWEPLTAVLWLSVAGGASIIERWLGGEALAMPDD